MKKTFRNLLSLVLCVAMLLSLVSALGISVSAAGEVTTVTSTVDLSSLAANSDKTSAATTILAAGAHEVSNMCLENSYDGFAHPGGNMGEGYIVVKLDAGDGNVFMTAPVVDLTYWLAQLDGDGTALTNQGYITVTGGVDGSSFPITFYNQTTGVGQVYQENARQYQSIALHGAQGLQTVYVKIAVQHWGAPHAGGIQSIVTTGYAVSSETYSDYTASSTLDFSSLSVSATEDFTVAADAITGLGAEAAENLVIADCYTKFVAGKGNAGEGYYIQTLDLGEGNTFAAAPILELNYWLASAASQGYVKVYGSVDGTNYYPFADLNTGKGAEYNLVSREDVAVVLDGAQGYQKVWVKVVIQHYTGATGGGVVKSILTGTSSTALSGSDTTEISNVLDFGTLTAGNVTTAQDDAIVGLGAVESNNFAIVDHYNIMATPTGGNAEAYYIQQLDAGDGYVFASDPTFVFDYRIAGGNGTIKIEASYDGGAFTEITTLTESTGTLYQESCEANTSITLTGGAGHQNVQVKVTIVRYGAEATGAVDRSEIVGTIQEGTPPSSGGEETGETVSNVLDFSDLTTTTEDFTAAAAAIVELGAVEARNLIVASATTNLVAGKGYAGEGYYVQKLTAGAGKVFADTPVLKLDYRVSTASPQGYVKVEMSLDGETYTQLANYNEGLGAAWSQDCYASASIPLTGAAGYRNVYVKVTMQHWTAPDGAAVDYSGITANATKGVPPTEGEKPRDLASVLDFSTLSTNEGDATAAILGLGALSSSGLATPSCYSVFAAPISGEVLSYYVQQLDAGDGYMFYDDLSMTLKYRLSGTDTRDYIKIEASYDGGAYTEIATLTESTGDSYTNTCIATSEFVLPATGYQTVNVKVSMLRYGGHDTAGVDYSAIAGVAVGASTGNYTSEIDFSALTRDENVTTAVDTIFAEGAYDVSNLYLGGNNGIVATPGGNMGEGYVVLKVSAAKNAALDNIALKLKYWAYNATGSNPGYLTISVSLDGENYTDVKTITGSSSLTTVQGNTVDPFLKLTSLYGATTAYVKVTMQHWESYEGAALEYIGLTSTPNNMKGDINSDTMLSGLDVEYLRGAVLGGKRKDAAQQDMNADGAVNVCDVVTRMRYEGANYSEAAVDSEYVMNFGDVTLYGEASNQSAVTTSGTVNKVNAGSGVTGGAGDYANETYGYVELAARNAYIEFKMPVPTTGAVTLDIEEIHERSDAKIAYTVTVNGTTVGTRSYDPNSTGPNHFFMDVPASVHGGADTMTVRITDSRYSWGTYGNVRIRRVWALPDVDVLASAQGVATKMKLGIMLPEVPTNKTIDQLRSLVESYQKDGVYEVALCWEMNYMIWGKEGTEPQINHVLNAAAEIGAPLYLGISSWWGGTPTDGMDGEGGSWSDPKYSQVSSKVNSNKYSLTTPNEFSNTPWNTMNNDNYNTVRAERIKETIAYIQRRSTEMTMGGTSLPTVHLYTENEPYYWPLNWAVSDNDGEYGDFNPATVADAKADGVTLNPDDGMSDAELDWLFKNLHTYISEVGEAFMDGAGTNYITIENGNVTYPQQLLTDKSYTHSMLATSLYTGHDINERAWENHILNTIHMGGEYNDVLAATRDSQPSSGSMDNMIEDLRALQYMASYGSHANVNCEYIGMDDGFGIIPQYYAYGVDGTVIYNITNTQDDFDLVRAEAACGSETVSGTGYTRTQLRTRYQMVAARADVERLLARYATQDGTYTRATELYAQARYGEALKLLSAALSTQLTEDSAVDFMVKGYGTLGDFPVYVKTANNAMAAIRLLAVADDYVKFELMESDAKSIDISLLNASGNYVLNNLNGNTWEITKAETGTAAADARVTFTVTYRDICPKTVIGEIREKGDTYLMIRTEDEAVGGYSYFRTFGWTGGNKSNVTVTRTAYGAATTSATVDDLQPGDYVCVQLDDDYNVKSVEAQYLTATVRVTDITTAMDGKTNQVSNPIVVAEGIYRIEVGGDTELIYSGSTTYLRNYDATSTFGLSVGDTITVNISLYNLWYHGGTYRDASLTDVNLRAQSITK